MDDAGEDVSRVLCGRGGRIAVDSVAIGRFTLLTARPVFGVRGG